MKNQYVGDIGDYGKYGLLRFLTNHGIKIGINWYLTEDDGSSDGRHTGYLNRPEEAIYDSELFKSLQKIAFRSDKTVRMIEDANIIPGAEFYGQILKSRTLEADERELNRRLWFNNAVLVFESTELIFADPDNGISYRKTARAKDSEKFILPEEICRYYNSGKNVVFYCHKGRRKQEAWEQTKASIQDHIRDASILAVTCHRGTQRSYIFVLHPDSYLKYNRILKDFLISDWGKMFSWEPVRSNIFRSSDQAAIENRVKLELLKGRFSVCKVIDYSGIDLIQPFCFTGATDEERSLVCTESLVPGNTTERDDGWRGFRIVGQLDFSLIGILACIAEVLASNRISIFAVSTFNTDYIFTKEEQFEKALNVLKAAGYTINGEK